MYLYNKYNTFNKSVVGSSGYFSMVGGLEFNSYHTIFLYFINFEINNLYNKYNTFITKVLVGPSDFFLMCGVRVLEFESEVAKSKQKFFKHFASYSDGPSIRAIGPVGLGCFGRPIRTC